jgi:hypothetical protein
MSAMGAIAETRLIRGDGLVPSRVEQVLRQIKVDKFTGNVILNIKEGRILGFHKTEIVMLPAAEI